MRNIPRERASLHATAYSLLVSVLWCWGAWERAAGRRSGGLRGVSTRLLQVELPLDRGKRRSGCIKQTVSEKSSELGVRDRGTACLFSHHVPYRLRARSRSPCPPRMSAAYRKRDPQAGDPPDLSPRAGAAADADAEVGCCQVLLGTSPNAALCTLNRRCFGQHPTTWRTIFARP